MSDIDVIRKIEKEYGLSFYEADYIEIDFSRVFYSLRRDEISKSVKSLIRYEDYVNTYRRGVDDHSIQRLGWDFINEIKFKQLISFLEPESDPYALASFFGQVPFYSIDDNHRIKELVISFHDIGTFPKEIYGLKSLEYLALRDCNLTTIENDISGLEKLTTLDIGSNPLKQLDFLSDGLSNLEYLCADNIGLNTLEYNTIKNCPKLSSLFLVKNPIDTISSTVFDHTALWKVWDRLKKIQNKKNHFVRTQSYEEAAKLRDNERRLISDLGFGLTLDIQRMVMPPETQWSKELSQLKLFVRKFEGQQRALNEVKLNVIGEGASGKTSLIKRLFNEDFDPHEPQTHGIRINKLVLNDQGDDVLLNIWDFGGQDIMHSTHQFFLSKRSMYIIVVDSRKDESVEYWLNHVISFGGNSPVLIVINKVDENPGYDLNRKFLKEKYPNILGFYRVSCFMGTGISELESGIISGLKSVEHLKMPWAQNWLKVKADLENWKDDFLDIKEYLNLCLRRNIKDQEAKVLLGYLNDLGSVIFFQEIELKNTSVINPEWITNGVYSIINHPILAENQGKLHLTRLEEILDKEHYPPEKHTYLFALMMKFELCFKITKDEILIPDLLPLDQPDKLPKEEIILNYSYKFIPKSIIANIIVRFNKDIFQNIAWRTGAVLYNDRLKTFVSVVLDREERLIRVVAEGKNKREYLSIVRYQLDDINKSFLNLDWTEKIVLPDDRKVDISLSHLLRLEQAGEKFVFPENAIRKYEIKELLGSVNQPKEEILDDIVELLRELKVEINGIKDIEKQMHHVLELKPNFMGIGVNLNEILDRFNNAFDS